MKLKMKNRLILLSVLAVLLIGVVLIFFRNNEDAWLCQNGQWVKHGQPFAPMPNGGCGPINNLVLESEDNLEKNLPQKPESINIIYPLPGDEIASPLKISGEAKGWYFEGSFPIMLTDRSGLVIAQGTAVAKSSWMTENFVPFEAVLEFKKPANSAKGVLILKKDNPSGLPQYDAIYALPLLFK